MSVEIRQTFEREFELFLSTQEIAGLTFAKIGEMSAKYEENRQRKEKCLEEEEESGLLGMQLLYRNIGNEKVVPETCYKLKTMEEPGRTEVFLIPGIEGSATIFKDIESKLKSPACCLQLGLDTINKQILMI